MSESETEEVEADSVIQNMKDRRKASGQEIADIKLRHGLKLAQKLWLSKGFWLKDISALDFSTPCFNPTPFQP